MADIQISSTKKYVLIIGLIVALVAAAAIFIGTRSSDENNEKSNKGDSSVSETEKSETESSKTGTVELSIERLDPEDFINPPEQDPNNPISVTEHGGYVTDGEVMWQAAGSSSCPPIIISATYDYEYNTVNMTQANYAGKMCTMDIRPLQQRIFIEGGENIPSDAKLNIDKAL